MYSKFNLKNALKGYTYLIYISKYIHNIYLLSRLYISKYRNILVSHVNLVLGQS